MRKLPLFNAVLEEETDGITTISWVSCPATEIEMLLFDKDNVLQFADDEKHMVSSVVMLCDTPIYRRTGDFEYYIQYEKDTLLKMCEKMLKENTFKSISFEHNGKNIKEGLINLVELYTTDEHKPSPFDVKYGSIVATYKIEDDELWDVFKNSSLSGISLEGYFGMKEVLDTDKYTKHTNMNIKELLKKMLTNFTESKVGEDTWLYDGELAEGVAVTLESGEPVADGEYEVEGKKVTIKDGVVESVEEVKEPETEEPVTEEPAETMEETTEPEVTEPVADEPEEPKTDEPDVKADVDALKSEVEALKTELETIKETLNELVATPAAAPAVEEYQNVTPDKSKGNKTTSILSCLNK